MRNVITIAIIIGSFFLSGCGDNSHVPIGTVKCYQDNPFERRCYTLLESRTETGYWPNTTYDKIFNQQTGEVSIEQRENSPFYGNIT